MTDVSNQRDTGTDDAYLDGTVDARHQAAAIVAAYRKSLRERRVTPTRSIDEVAADLGWQLPAGPTPPGEVINLLAEAADGGLTATAGPRYFGFVIGGSLPAATAADVLAVGWDQNAFNSVTSPAAGAAELVAGSWLKD